MREVHIDDYNLSINSLGISLGLDSRRTPMNAVEVEELSDEHIAQDYIESLMEGLRQGAFCARELQRMFGIETESQGSFLISVDEKTLGQ